MTDLDYPTTTLPAEAWRPGAATRHARRTLLLLAKRPRTDLRACIDAGLEPRTEYMALAERSGAELVDFHHVARSRHPLVRALSVLGGERWGLAALGALRHRAFDDIYATGEDVGLPLALMLRVLRVRGKLTMVTHNAATPKRSALLRALGHEIFRRLICYGADQLELLAGLGMPRAKISRLDYYVDQDFYRPVAKADGDFVLSVGFEARDYASLMEAARELSCRVHVVASGWSPGGGFQHAGGVERAGNVEVERNVSSERLRELYASARIVVLPLQRVSYAAGVTSLVEAMAMGKPIVATDSPGLRDYVADGRVAVVTRAGDPAGLRGAIDALWDDAARREAMGRENRERVDRALTIDRFASVVAELLSEDPPPAAPRRDVPPTVALPPRRGLHVDEVRTSAELERLAGEWESLFRRVPHALPFASHEWVAAWWKHLRREGPQVRDSLRVYVVRTTDGEPVAFAPYMRSDYRLFGAPVVRVLQPMGSDAYLTEIRGMLVTPEREADAVAALLAHLGRQPEADWVRWSGLRRDGAAYARLAGLRCTAVDWEMSAHLLPLFGPWDDFRRSLPRNLRESLRKCYNSLARDGHAWRFHVLDSTDEVLASLERFFDLHARRASAANTVRHPDYFVRPEARAFITQVMERMGRRGRARAFQLEIAGEVVAMRLGFQLPDSLYLYYSGYEPAWGQYSVMTTVVAEAVRHALERGVPAVNLSTGSDVSKTRWRPRELPFADAVVRSPGLRAWCAWRMFRTGRHLTERLRSASV